MDGNFTVQVDKYIGNGKEYDSLWGLIYLNDNEKIWFQNEKLNGMRDTQVAEELEKCTTICGAVVENEFSMDYSQMSKNFEVSESILSELMVSNLTIQFYQGGHRDKVNSDLVGECKIQMDELIFSGGVDNEEYDVRDVTVMEDDNMETSDGVLNKVYVSIRFSMEVVDFVVGGRSLCLNQFSIGNLPPEWFTEVDVENDKMRYSLSINFENITNREIRLENGKLCFIKDEEEAEEEEDGQGTYNVQWGEEHVRQFLYKDTVKAFLKVPNENTKIAISMERLDSTKDNYQMDAWRLEGVIELDGLAEPGIVSIAPSGILKHSGMMSKEHLEELVNKTEGKDEKKTLQAKLDAYDDTLAIVAGRSAVLLSAKTALSCTIAANETFMDPKVNIPRVVATVSEIVPLRDPLPSFPPRDACDELQIRVKTIVKNIFEQYEKLFDGESDENGNLSRNERKTKLLYHLNSECIYIQFKETIKQNIVQVVQEQFPTAPASGVQNASDSAFYTKLYVYLMEQVNNALNELFTNPNEVAQIVLGESSDSTNEKQIEKQIEKQLFLKRALESEQRNDLKKAAEFFLQLIAYAEEHAQEIGSYDHYAWYEYALYCCRQKEFQQAGEAFRQCLSISPNYLPALQAYGAMLTELTDFSAAEVMLKAAVKDEMEEEEPKSKFSEITHGILALFFRVNGEDETGRMTAFELLTAQQRSEDTNADVSTCCINTASYLIDLKLVKLTDEAIKLSKTNRKSGTSMSKEHRISLRLSQAKLSLLLENKEHTAAYLKEASEIDRTTADAWYYLGNLNRDMGRQEDALRNYTAALQYEKNLHARNLLPLYMNLGELYLVTSDPENAKNVYLRGCERKIPSVSMWLGVGIACMRLEDWKAAEQALAEANTLESTNAEVWGYLALLCLSDSPQRPNEALMALKQSQNFGLENPTLLREIGNGLISIDALEKAESVFRLSLSYQDSSLTRKRLADVLSARNCAEAALEEYQTYLQTNKTSDDRCELLLKCSHLLTTLGRTEEANSYREMAKQQEMRLVENNPAMEETQLPEAI